jgi:hypothetical protein
LSDPASLESYSCPFVTGNDVLFHVFNIVHSSKDVQIFF